MAKYDITTPEGRSGAIEALEKAMNLDSLLFKTMSYAGEQAIRDARLDHTNNYEDQTGNLRSSVGYKIIQNGSAKKVSTLKVFKKRQEGVEAMESFLDDAEGLFKKGTTLVVCAGMEYAEHVENKGYNVISFTMPTARDFVDSALKRIKR